MSDIHSTPAPTLTTAEPCLLIDAGNTRIKWQYLASSAADQPLAEGDFIHTDSTATQVGEALHAAWQALPPCQHIWVSCVARAELGQNIQTQLNILQPQAKHHFLNSLYPAAHLINGYTQPATLGTDRWIQAIAAAHLHPNQTLLIASAGTATTLDCVHAPTAQQPQAVFMGGCILPGAHLMLDSLASNTGLLPKLSIAAHANHAVSALQEIPTHTEQAILYGCLHAQIGAIERMQQTLQIATAQPPLILLTGGNAAFLLPYLTFPVKHYPDLLMRGLRYIAHQTRSITRS